MPCKQTHIHTYTQAQQTTALSLLDRLRPTLHRPDIITAHATGAISSLLGTQHARLRTLLGKRHAGRQTLDALVVDILILEGDDQVQEHGEQRSNREASFHDKLDSIQEALERLVVSGVSEEAGKVSRDKRGAVAEGQAGGQHEAVAAVEGHAAGDDGDAGDGDRSEQEGGHAADDGGRDGDERGRELGEDAHDDEEEAAAEAGGAVGAASQSDDAVVLRKGRHGRDGAEGGEDAVDSVRQHTALHAGLVELALDFQAGDVAGRGDVADGFAGADEVDG